MHRLRFCAIAAVTLVAACSQPAPPQATRPSKPAYDIVAQIRAAGEREKSAIEVAPLRDPGVQGLEKAAQADEQAGRYPDADAKLVQALKMAPQAPELIQDRAEVAVRMQDFPLAEKLARQSSTWARSRAASARVTGRPFTKCACRRTTRPRPWQPGLR